MSLTPEEKAGFEAFFDGEDRRIQITYGEGVPAEQRVQRLDDDRMTALPKVTERLCTSWSPTKDKLAVLLDAERGELKSVNKISRGFRRLRLIDEQMRLTRWGRCKLIASLPLAEQVLRLPVVFEEVRMPRRIGLSTEGYIVDRYQRLGYECIKDEGGSFAGLMKYSWLNDIPVLKSMMENDQLGRDSKHFCYSTDWWAFARERGGRDYIPPEHAEKLMAIWRKTTPARLSTGQQLVEEECRTTGLPRQPWPNLDLLLRVFDALGLERFLKLCELAVSDWDSIGGWPDITAFKDGRFVLVEVKQKDKLMFHQVRTIEAIATLVPDVLSELRIEKLVLE